MNTGRSVKNCQLRPKSPTRRNGVSGSVLEVETRDIAHGMRMVDESSTTELKVRASVKRGNV